MQPSDLLCKVAEQKKLSHAYLFSGNNHAEKYALVQKLQELLGVQPGDYLNVSLAKEDKSEIAIAQIRALSSFANMSAWNSPCKIVALEHAHAMSWEAQGALLKLLEEPKGDTIFFLLTEYPESLFDTIRSRTQEYSFYSFAPRTISDATIAEFQKLQKADLASRFAQAKILAEKQEQIAEILDNWLLAARQILYLSLREDHSLALGLARTIAIIQETNMLLRTTNINPRLALERIMLNL